MPQRTDNYVEIDHDPQERTDYGHIKKGALTPIGGDLDLNFAEAARVFGADLGDFHDLVLSRLRRVAAHDLLRRAAAQDFGWRADASADERIAAVEKWRAWWLSVSGRRVYDPAKKLLVAP